jgi:uncharacterized protein (DUF2062 family)
MRKLLKSWLPTPTGNRDTSRLPRWPTFPRDPRLWTLRRHSVALGAGIGAMVGVIPLPIQIPAAILKLANLLDAVSDMGPPLLIGLPVLGAALALAAYVAVMVGWRFAVVWRGRSRWRAARP